MYLTNIVLKINRADTVNGFRLLLVALFILSLHLPFQRHVIIGGQQGIPEIENRKGKIVRIMTSSQKEIMQTI